MKIRACGIVFFFSIAFFGIVSLYISRSMIINVYLSLDKRSFLVKTWSRTVGDLFKEFGLDPKGKDRVYPPPETILRNGLGIYLVRVEERIERVEKKIPAPVYRKVIPTLVSAKGRVVREGRDGLVVELYRIRFARGREIGREMIERRVVRHPKPYVIFDYRRVELVRTLDPSSYPSMEMIATAYSPEEGFVRTATGKRAKKGIVAVDPRVIPLGTRLYVHGYGEAVAEDIGSAIKGKRIDLCFDTLREARSFGRRKVKVYILGRK